MPPPFVGVAVKVTDVPEHIDVPVEIIFTAAAPACDTVIEILFDVAGEPVAQLNADVINTFTISALDNVFVVKVGEFGPVLTLLTCH